MSRKVLAGTKQYLISADVNRLGAFPQEALDGIVVAAIGYPAHWAGFTVSQASSQVVTVTPGRYLEGERVYAANDAEDINLITYFPLAPSDEKWVAIIARGRTRQISESRQYETSLDPYTRVPVSDERPVMEERYVEFVLQQGSAVPAPATKPAIAETDACLAFVKLTTEGIREIVPGEEWRAKTLYEVEGRVTSIEQRVDQLFEDTETVRTDVSNLGSDVNAIKRAMPDGRLVAQIVRDTARHSQALNMPEEARNYWFDQGLIRHGDDCQWDYAAGGYFRVDEGIRFEFAAQRDHLLLLAEPSDPKISVWGNRLVMPAHSEVTRITSPEGSGRKDISNTVHTEVNAVKKTRSHTRIRHGETVTVCENSAGWEQVGDKKAGQVFKANGEEWVSAGKTNNPWNDTDQGQSGHAEYAVRRLIRETYTTSYTVYNTETFGLSGAIYGNTFLCAQVMIATSIDLNFTRVGPTGDVILALCEVNGSAAPDFEAVLAIVTVGRDDIVNGWNRFHIEPTLLEQGRRYAWFTVTSGNHQLMSNTGNAFAGGTMFVCTDGAWAQGNATEDFAFRVNAAKFASSRTVMQMQPLNLDGGMTEIEMVFKALEPAATKLAWELQIPSMGPDAPWIPIDAREDNPLANLPPMVLLRAVFVGTEDVAPVLDLDQWARVIAGRMRPDMRAISKLKEFGFGTDAASLVINVDEYDPARHTVAPKMLLANNTVVEPAAVVIEADQSKPTRRKVTANFELPDGTTQARARVDMTTDSVIHVPFVQDIQGNWF